MKNIMALALLLGSIASLADTTLCNARLENTFSRTHVGFLSLKSSGSKTVTQIKKSNGTTLISSSISKEQILKKNSYHFNNFVIEMKDNGLPTAGLKSLTLRRIDFGSLDLNFVTTKSVRFVSSDDGFLFGVCK